MPDKNKAPDKGRFASTTQKLKEIDWKAKAIETSKICCLALVLLLHLYATIVNFSQGTDVALYCLLAAFMAIGGAAVLYKPLGPGNTAMLAFSLFSAPIALSAVFYAGPKARGFVLAGLTTSFWASAVCLGTLVGLSIWVTTRSVPVPLRIILGMPLLYSSVGFIVGIVEGAPLDLVVLGAGPLAGIPFVAQPASFYLNVVLPIALLAIAVMAITAVVRDKKEQLPSHAAAFVFLIIPLVMGLTIMNRYLIPNLTFLVTGKPVGSGYVKVQYSSAWDAKDDGSKDHFVEIYTRTYKPGAKTSYSLKASVVPPKNKDEHTSFTLSVKDTRTGADVLNLDAKDLLVKEDGELQNHGLVADLDQMALGKVHVVLCLDFSGSMSNFLDELRAASHDFIQGLGSHYFMEVLAFGSSHVNSTNGFTKDKEKIQKAIEEQGGLGGTAINDAVDQGFSDLEGVENPGRRVVVLFTDGSGSGQISDAALFKRIEGCGITIFTIGMGSVNDTVLKKMASITGGQYFHAADSQQLTTAFLEALAYVSCSYELEYRKPLAPPPAITILTPTEGQALQGSFDIAAEVTGELREVQFLLGPLPLKTETVTGAGTFRHEGEKADDHAAGAHTIRVRATDRLGQMRSEEVSIVIKRRVPEVVISKPARDTVLWRNAKIVAEVTGKNYRRLRFYLDGKELISFSPDKGPGFSHPLKLDGLRPGFHTIICRAEMADGRSGEARRSFKFIAPKPEISFITPKDGESVFGRVPVCLKVSSGWHELPIDKVTLHTSPTNSKTLSGPSYRFDWDTVDIPAGPVTLRAVARNEAGLTSEATVDLRVIKPRFSAAFRSPTAEQVIGRTTTIRVDVVNEHPKAIVDSVEVTIAGKRLGRRNSQPWEFKLDPRKFERGRARLRADVRRMDGATTKAEISVVIEPPRQVKLFCAARKSNGRYLRPDQLEWAEPQVTEDGKPVQNLEITPAGNLPSRFILVIDTSGSMAQEKKMQKAREAACVFTDLMKSSDKAAIFAFATEVEIVSSFTDDRTSLKGAIKTLVPYGATALYDAVHRAAVHTSDVEERSALIVLTDGIDQNADHTGPGSHRPLREVVQYAKEQDVQVFTIGLGRDLQLDRSYGERVLKALSKTTGGSYFFASSASRLMNIYQTIIEEVGSQALFCFESPSGGNDGLWHDIDITLPSKPSVKLIYKKGYYAR